MEAAQQLPRQFHTSGVCQTYVMRLKLKSRLSAGHAGSRIGWAIVSDDALAAKMVALAQGPMSYESQARATVLIEQILGTQGMLPVSAYNMDISLQRPC